jgi:5'-nucleotidase
VALDFEEIEARADETTQITRNYMAEGQVHNPVCKILYSDIYLSPRYDGFEALKNRKFIVDDDNGQIMSSIVRSFLLGKSVFLDGIGKQADMPHQSGSAYIFRHKQIRHEHRKHLSARTDKVISRARRQWSYDAAADHMHDHHGHMPNGLHSPTTSVSTLDDSHMSSSPVASSILSPGGTPRRHVVAHSNNDIRDALHVARHDHMSDADCFVRGLVSSGSGVCC